MVRTYYNDSNATKIYGGVPILSPRCEPSRENVLFNQRKTKNHIKREKIHFNSKSEAKENFLNPQRNWNKPKQEDIMPVNDWPHVVDTRRTIIPKFEESKTFRPSCNIQQSSRNYNGNGNILSVMLKGDVGIEGFHNSNRLYREGSISKSHRNLDKP